MRPDNVAEPVQLKQNQTRFTCQLPVPTMGALAGIDQFQPTLITFKFFAKITHASGIPNSGDFHPDRSGGHVLPR